MNSTPYLTLHSSTVQYPVSLTGIPVHSTNVGTRTRSDPGRLTGCSFLDDIGRGEGSDCDPKRLERRHGVDELERVLVRSAFAALEDCLGLAPVIFDQLWG